MKIGMVLLLLMVLVTAYLIGRAVRNGIKSRQAQALAQARWAALWEVFSDPDGSVIQVGVRKVARSGRWCEVIDSEILTRVDATLPDFEKETEVRIARTNAESYANLLNS